MSIDIEVIPTKKLFLKWKELKSQMLLDVANCRSKAAIELFGQTPTLSHARFDNKRAVKDDEKILPTSFYKFSLARSNTVSFSCVSNTGPGYDFLDAMQAYFEDHGQNLTQDSVTEICQVWTEIGFFYDFTSYGARAVGELDLLIPMSRSVAKLTSGLIVIKDPNVFNLPSGTYSLDEFSLCKFSS